MLEASLSLGLALYTLKVSCLLYVILLPAQTTLDDLFIAKSKSNRKATLGCFIAGYTDLFTLH